MVSFGERSFYHMDVKFALYNCLQQFFSCLLSLKQPSLSYIGGRTLVTGTLKGKGSRVRVIGVNWVNFDQGQQSLV